MNIKYRISFYLHLLKIKVSLIFILLFIMESCYSSQTASYIKEIRIEAKNNNDGFYSLTSNEVVKRLKDTDIYYIGTDDKYNYFVVFYDKTVKESAKFKINKNEKIKLHEQILFNKNNKWQDGYKVLLKVFDN